MKKKSRRRENDRKSRRGREMGGGGGFGAPLRVSVSPVVRTGTVDGKEAQKDVDEKFLELAGWPSDTCL